MELKLHETIRALRKEKLLTQEQLAQALGVSAGAVSKWESGLSNPDLSLLPELAALFDTSVDALLGYEWQEQSEKQAADAIHRMNLERNFGEASTQVPLLAKKYPNSFRVLLEAGKCLLNHSIGQGGADAGILARQYLERACELFGQNTDPSLSREKIQSEIAMLLQEQNRCEQAVELLKKNNVCGVFNARIGEYLTQMDRRSEAARFASDDLIVSITNLFMDTLTLVNALGERGETDEALAMSQWMQDLLRGLRTQDGGSYPQRMGVVLLALDAMMLLDRGDGAQARARLESARREAEQYDRAPRYGNDSVRFYRGEPHSFYDSFGGTCLSGVERILREESEPAAQDALLAMWREVCNETETG